MEFRFSKAFVRDLEIYGNNEAFARQFEGKIKEIQRAISIDEIPGLEKIRGRNIFYRFKIRSQRVVYRIGLQTLHNKVWFTLIDTDKKRFYKRI